MIATIRRKKKLIFRIKKEETVLTDPIEIKKEFIHHFQQLYASQELTLFDISSLCLNKITPEECKSQLLHWKLRKPYLAVALLKHEGMTVSI